MIRIKLAILESDQNYLERIMTVFTSRYSEKLEVFFFTAPAAAMEALEEKRIEVFLASEAFQIDVKQIPKRCAFAYFTESNAIDTLYGQRTVCKFQKVDLIYREILSLFSEKSGEIIGYKKDDSDSTVILAFGSPCGGDGSSSAAAGAALYFAGQGKKVLYLNIERFGCTDLFFHSEGQYTLSDVLYSIKSRKSNLTLKLEGSVRQDASGVFFYESYGHALDVEEMKEEDIARLLDELQISGLYEYIIVDMSFSFQPVGMAVCRKARGIVMTAGPSGASDLKLKRALQSIDILDRKTDGVIMKKLHLLRNKYSGGQAGNYPIAVLGSITNYGSIAHDQAAKLISETNVFRSFLQ